jgi:T-complex protein 1 subunit alpha
MAGYRLALRESVKFINEHLSVPVDSLGRDALINSAKTSMSSKLLFGEAQFFAEMVVNSIQAVKATNVMGEISYPVKNDHILKCHGNYTKESLRELMVTLLNLAGQHKECHTTSKMPKLLVSTLT